MPKKAVSIRRDNGKHCRTYFAFNHSLLAVDEIAPIVLLSHEAK